MIDPEQLRDFVVTPTLKEIGLYSKAAMRLVIGTGLVESQLTYLHQINGIALGIYQCEPATHKDIWDNFLMYKIHIAKRLNEFNMDYRDVRQLVYNLKYATAICRIHYLRDPNPLPDENDIEGMAKTWKSVYNTHLGKGTVEKFMKHSEIILNL